MEIIIKINRFYQYNIHILNIYIYIFSLVWGWVSSINGAATWSVWSVKTENITVQSNNLNLKHNNNIHYISAIQCEHGTEYKPCINVCGTRCDQPHYNVTKCPSPCMEGCGCGNTTLMKNGRCHEVEDLSCTDVDTGIEYSQGAQIVKDCRKW